MRKARTEVAQNVDLVVSILQHLDDHEFRATMACVCKTWQACVRQSWDRVHICFDSENALVARLAWLERQLNHPLQLKSLELHSGYSLAPTSVGYGLERFGALSHLDMQSLGGKTWPWNEGLESQLTRLALRPAAVAKLAALSDTLQTLRLAYYEDVPYRMPWTLDVFSAFTSLTELRIGLLCSGHSSTCVQITESLKGLPKLQHLEVHGLWYHTVAEEKPGLLNKVLEGLTSLHLRVDALHCSDITSPNLRCLTVILNDRRDDRRLQVASCPQLWTLHHNASKVVQLGQYTMLQSLSIVGPRGYGYTPIQFSLVEGLTPLTRVQHLHLTQYQSGDGFSEMLLFEGLKTLRLHLLKAPQRLYFAKGFSKLKQLTNVELLRDYHDIYRPPDRSFSGKVDHLPALQVLSLQCGSMEAAMSSHSLVEVKMESLEGHPFMAWPLVAHCGSLTRLHLKCLPAFLERLPDACHSLREMQLTYAYAVTPMAGYDPFYWDVEWMQKHSCRVQTLISQLLEAGTLRALQVAAVHSSLCIDISRLATSGLQHLALACERLRLEGRRGKCRAPPVPSIHLFTWGRDSSVRHLKACIPALKCSELDVDMEDADLRWAKGTLYKCGPQHDLDLVEVDLVAELADAD